ncbi:MAG: tetraacyldisaccharide 4'-kinase, partial [Parvularculaceae bacterium]|nr:tetraacyldisaccharide 4'-kinase [Parvularculaceae bacterium]
MIAEPRFWRDASRASRVAAAVLSPLSALYDGAQRLRAATAREAEATLPVFCVGAATLGGVGKTPFALLLARRIGALGRRAAFLTRGYGGRLAGPLLVDPSVHGGGVNL